VVAAWRAGGNAYVDRWNIKGCDTNLIGPSSCQKHWSVSVTG